MSVLKTLHSVCLAYTTFLNCKVKWRLLDSLMSDRHASKCPSSLIVEQRLTPFFQASHPFDSSHSAYQILLVLPPEYSQNRILLILSVAPPLWILLLSPAWTWTISAAWWSKVSFCPCPLESFQPSNKTDSLQMLDLVTMPSILCSELLSYANEGMLL